MESYSSTTKLRLIAGKAFVQIVFAFVIASFMGCNPDSPLPTCDTSNSEFQTIFQNMLATGHNDQVFIDTEVHEYTFTLSTTKSLCKIGYRSHSALANTPYTIAIVDNTNSTTIYTGNHVFSSSATSYVSLNAPVILQAGNSYTVKRIQTNWGGNIGNTVGRVARKSPMSFPYTAGIMTITNAKFYQHTVSSSVLNNFALPYVDLIFA
ncbi:MAG: hypothetical protein RMJ87_02445 [Cytophagales bacterium]|nr:hypothetical protein [Bernardetiaceae bacterium]MDW8203865.1 hypothetical protein [Cytophagales bacterium]